MKEFVNGTKAQYDSMKQKLDGNRGRLCRYHNVHLGIGYRPRCLDLDIGLLESGSYFLRFSPSVTPPDDAPQAVKDVAQQGFLSYDFEELVNTLKVTLAPMAESAPQTQQPTPQPPQQTQQTQQPTESQPQEPPVNQSPRIVDEPTELPQEKDEPLIDPDSLRAAMQRRMIGYDGMLGEISQLVANHLGKAYPQRPLSMMVAGRPGMGKTFTAESLCEALNELGLKYGLIRIDLNTYKDSISANRMVGAAAGYVGYGDGLVFDPLLEEPRQIILMDEAGKAHKDVQDLLLQIMDKGQLQLAAPVHGKRTVDFRKAILVYTTNHPVDESRLSLTGDEALRQMLTEGSDGFKPEFVSRLQYCTYYPPLTPRQQLQVAASCIGAVASEYGLELDSVHYEALKALTEGQSRFGARMFKSRSDILFGLLFARGYRDGLRKVELSREPDGRFVLHDLSLREHPTDLNSGEGPDEGVNTPQGEEPPEEPAPPRKPHEDEAGPLPL